MATDAAKIIWHKPYTLADLERLNARPHMGQHLDIRFEDLGPDYLVASMPVDHRTHQPAGLLHGGANVVLAETLGSVGSWLVIDPQRFQAVGLEVNANHLRPVREGRVTGTCCPIQMGRNIHVWEIRIHDARERLVCVSRLTCAIVSAEPPQTA